MSDMLEIMEEIGKLRDKVKERFSEMKEKYLSEEEK